MQIRLFTLCDGAFNYNGKLTVVGTVDNIKVPKYPFNADISLAIKIAFLPSENGEKAVTVKIVDDSGVNIIPEMHAKTTILSKGDEGKLSLAVDLHGVRLEKEGSYKVILCVNNKEYELPFKTVKQ